MTAAAPLRPVGLLGDTSARDYTGKLRLFNAFAEPELRRAIATLNLVPGMRVLDIGCGTGEVLTWLSGHVGPAGVVAGLDLAFAHAAAARFCAEPGTLVVQADLLQVPFVDAQFDLIWCVNTIHHLRDPLEGVQTLVRLLRPRGRIVLGQSGLLPELLFAWDSRLERLTHEAVRQYYRDRYRVTERELTNDRSIVGLLRRVGLADVNVQTLLIERLSPLRPVDERYLLDAIFRGTWGEHLRPYMPNDDFAQLERLCDPTHADFAPRRPDFQFIQSFSMATGQANGHTPVLSAAD